MSHSFSSFFSLPTGTFSSVPRTFSPATRTFSPATRTLSSATHSFTFACHFIIISKLSICLSLDYNIQIKTELAATRETGKIAHLN
ncbi:hypothetical protein HanXRQr2_Chr04g0187761 [Helianthus annuus]|uniref:Uncharacterized protein n=1 Tax=Helianthus annuus TaxID=4232 RepID=A0A9K3NTZ3_HELAN|nr:hypothetical protein HanXRQr2_Chr04g0187761 [Helianthus annuus]